MASRPNFSIGTDVCRAPLKTPRNIPKSPGSVPKKTARPEWHAADRTPRIYGIRRNLNGLRTVRVRIAGRRRRDGGGDGGGGITLCPWVGRLQKLNEWLQRKPEDERTQRKFAYTALFLVGRGETSFLRFRIYTAAVFSI